MLPQYRTFISFIQLGNAPYANECDSVRFYFFHFFVFTEKGGEDGNKVSKL